MQRVIKKAVKSHPAYDKVCAMMIELEDEVIEINQEIGIESDNAGTVDAPCEARKSLKFNDPQVSQCEGKRKPQRLKPACEVKDAKKMRTCSYCHKKRSQYVLLVQR
jgi:hypothetical protein